MGIRLNTNIGRTKPSFFSPDLFKVLGMVLTIQATVGVAILGRTVLHLDDVTDQAAAQVLMTQGEGMAMAYVLFCRMGGGLAWLIFAMLAVTGFQYTADPLRYLARVGITALISEIPYNLCTAGTWFSFQSQNAVFSLLLGLAILYLVEEVVQHPFGRIALMVGAVIWSFLLRLQNGYLITTAMFLFYYLEEREFLRDLLILGLSALDMLFLGPQIGLISTVIPCILGLLLLHKYDDTNSPRLNKWVAYAVYPLHLVIIAILCRFVFAA